MIILENGETRHLDKDPRLYHKELEPHRPSTGRVHCTLSRFLCYDFHI